MRKFHTVTVVGLGVIGGSYAKALSALGYRVLGVDSDAQTLQAAADDGAIEQGASDPDAFFAQSDLIVFALYPSRIADYLHAHLHAIAADCVLTDVAGLKSHFVQQICASLADRADLQFVFCHPMAGREKRGYAYADPSVFCGANFIVTPTRTACEETIERVEALAREIGFGRIRRITPQLHDEMIAFTSQLPHAIAVALINGDTHPDTGDFIGDSYRDLTRIANINEDLWTQLFLENADNLIAQLDAFERQLRIVRDAVAARDAQTLRETMIRAGIRRRKLESDRAKKQ